MDARGHAERRAASFTEKYVISTNRLIFGPYEEVLTMPMRRHVDYTPVHGSHVQDSALCATCHTLFTPIVDAAGKVAGEFPEQVPYLEWRNSDHARAGRHCQDCHMPRQDEPTKVSRRMSPATRLGACVTTLVTRLLPLVALLRMRGK